MKRYAGNFYCFSPPVMLATMIVETGLAIYTLLRYKLTPLTRLVVTMLVLLAVFQLAEFNVCGKSGLPIADVWSRIGYAAITMLPVLGIHLIQTISKRGWYWIKWVAYISGLYFAVVLGLSASTFSGHVCAGNYAIFQLTNSGGSFFAYYYFWLFVGIGMSLYFSITAKQHVREALVLQAVGYLTFLLPTGLVNAINPKTIDGIPSIMCGFAVIYALLLALGIVPLLLSKQKSQN